MADRIRDRTLVLRIAYPALRSRLREKMSTAETDCAEAVSSAANADNNRDNHRMMLGGGNSSRGTLKEALLWDLDGVSCNPSEDGSTLWHFQCDGKTYPARLVNLPCPVEIHKTHDHAMFYKSADVGQILVVYEDQASLEEGEKASSYKVEGYPSYYHSGLTPPLKRVVERRFAVREHEGAPPSRDQVLDVEKELTALITTISKDTSKSKGKLKSPPAGTGASEATKIIEDIEEVVVDYEPWMDNNGQQPHGIQFDDTDDRCKKHPELWLPPTPREVKQESSSRHEGGGGEGGHKKSDKKKKSSSSSKKKSDKKKKKLQAEASAMDDMNKESSATTSNAPPTQKKKGIASKKNRAKGGGEIEDMLLESAKKMGADDAADEEIMDLGFNFDDDFDMGL